MESRSGLVWRRRRGKGRRGRGLRFTGGAWALCLASAVSANALPGAESAALARASLSGRAASLSSHPDLGGGRPAGLVQAGDSKTSCIYARLGAQLDRAERATGVDFHCIETFDDQVVSWSQWTSPWMTHKAFGYGRWLAASPSTRTIVLAQNLVPDSVARQPDWRAQCSSGDFDRYATQLASELVASGFAYSVIRLGPEMNGPWEADWIGNTPAQWHQWAGCFDRIVASMRSVPGTHFLFDWNVNAGYRVLPLSAFYPGDAYVDIVGVDAYDESPNKLPPVGSPRRWTALAAEPLGIDAVYAFAARHHKPFSIPEWGTIATNGDDGAYVADMGRFVADHDVAYQSWYDAGDNHTLPLLPTRAPHSVEAYIQYFGPRSLLERYQHAFARQSS